MCEIHSNLNGIRNVERLGVTEVVDSFTQRCLDDEVYPILILESVERLDFGESYHL